jgi:hypothetical protein
MKRKSKILIGSAIVFVALLGALFLAIKHLGGGPGSPTVEGSRAVTSGGIKIPGWNGRVDAAEERAGMTLSCLSWNWRGRSSVKIAERTHEKRAKALHRGREGGHPQAALVG